MADVGLDKSLLRGRVAVLCGGASGEREISLQSGAAVFTALQEEGIDVVQLDPSSDDFLARIQEENIAHSFIALHGVGGEDGVIQGFLQTLGITYTGSGTEASSLAMDKLRTKLIWQAMGLPTAKFLRLHADSDWQKVCDEYGEAFMVKPAKEGSSLGMRKAVGAQQLEAAFVHAADFGERVLAESWINGPEYTVAILDREVLPVIKLETDNEFYDYEAKYVSDETRYVCPCGLNPEEERTLQSLALEAFDSLGCSGWARVDIMIDAKLGPLLLEVNTVPGLTSHSLVPMAASHQGISFNELILRILQRSLLV